MGDSRVSGATGARGYDKFVSGERVKLRVLVVSVAEEEGRRGTHAL